METFLTRRNRTRFGCRLAFAATFRTPSSRPTTSQIWRGHSPASPRPRTLPCRPDQLAAKPLPPVFIFVTLCACTCRAWLPTATTREMPTRCPLSPPSPHACLINTAALLSRWLRPYNHRVRYVQSNAAAHRGQQHHNWKRSHQAAARKSSEHWKFRLLCA